MNLEDLSDEIGKFTNQFENRNLEEYLLSLYKIVLEEKDQEVSIELVAAMLAKAFTADPIPFDDSWLQIITLPSQNGWSRKMTNPEFTDSIDKEVTTDFEGVQFSLEVLKFQIAELHRMKGKQLEDKYRYFGIDSETGHRWYNFTPFENLSCGIRCMIDNDIDDKIDWSFVGHLFEGGRIYE